MDISKEVLEAIGSPESSALEYKAVLPPSRNIAQLIGAFANADGGILVLGIADDRTVVGLSQDFHANGITHKALDLLTPTPSVVYQYVSVGGKNVFAIKTEKSLIPVAVEGKIYKRIGDRTVLQNPFTPIFSIGGYERIKTISLDFESRKVSGTNAKIRLLEHYQSILKLMDDLGVLLYPGNPELATSNPEGKVLTRILFSSFVDNFETYLSDLLYEIFLANPSTLKSNQTVTIEEVLNCSDLQDFVKYWAKQKLGKLQKGSVKGFIKENKQISDLEVLNKEIQDRIEKILQIRHLYSHRNGIVDEKFLLFFQGQFSLNSEHQLSIKEMCDYIVYLSGIVDLVDSKSVAKYNLANTL